MSKISENIRAYRQQMGLSQAELAKLAGYSDRSSITKIEAGLVDLPQSKIKAFADIFRVSPSKLLGLDEDEYYFDPETAALAQELYDDPDLRILFDASRHLKPQDLKMLAEMARRLKGDQY